MHQHPMNRLVKAVDELAGQGIIQDVFIQTGFSSYRPKYCKWVQAIDFIGFERCMEEAEIIVSHGGAGCIAGALERNKPIVVVPRLKKYNEHNNDHQLELASVLEKSGRALVVYDIKDLADTIKKARNFRPVLAVGESQVIDIIRKFLVETAKQKGFRI